MLHSILITIAVQAMVVLLLRNARSPAQTMDGVQWLKYGKPLKAVGAFSVAVTVYVVADNLIAGRPLEALILGFLFAVMGVPICLLAYIWGVGYDANGIHCISPWRKNRFVPWSNVTGVSFSQIMKQWIVHTSQSGTIRVNILVPGSDQLIDELARRDVTVDHRPKTEAW